MPRPREVRGQGEADWIAHIAYLRSPGWKKGGCPCKLCAQKQKEAYSNYRLQEELPGAMKARAVLEAFEKEFGLIEKHAKDREFWTERGPVMIRTQKARGLAAVSGPYGYRLPTWLKPAPITGLLPYHGHGKQFDALTFPLFARPCPVRPRHGFVESRMVANGKELLHLLCETLAADPKGEVLLTPRLTGAASAVATDTGVVWGKGNAGVTSGKGKQFHIPVPHVEETLTEVFKKRNDTIKQDIAGSVYLEVVENKGNAVLVQVRDGPANSPVEGNYVPHRRFKVTNVLKVDGDGDDLIAWEKKIKSAINGTAVHLPGSSLTSHLAVHGIAHGLAVITAKAPPKVGDKLNPSKDQPARLTPADYRAMAGYLRKPLAFGGKRSRAAFAVSVLHAMPAWGNAPHLLHMRVAGAATLARLLVAACVGEARFFYSIGEGHYVSTAVPSTPWKKIINRPLSRSYGGSRYVLFDKSYHLPLRDQAQIAAGCEKDFSRYWGEDEPEGAAGFGGPRWRKSARIAKELCEALLAFKATPSANTWSAVLAAYNAGVNAVHNGGRLLDKWTERYEIDLAASNPQWGLLSPQAMHICTGVPLPMGLTEKNGGFPSAASGSLDSFLLGDKWKPGWKKGKKKAKKVTPKAKPAKPAKPAKLSAPAIKKMNARVAKEAKQYAQAVKMLKAQKVPGPYTIISKDAVKTLH